MKLVLDTPIVNLHRHDIAKLSVALSRKLAVALATQCDKTDVDAVTVEDLLNYFPARYEDRSNFLDIDQIEPGMEAAVELYVRNAAGVQVGRNRERWKPPLYIFEITGGDANRQHRPVTVKWFVSGKGAEGIVNWYRDRFPRGTRFVAYGLWDEDNRGQMFLKLAKPEEIEILPSEPPAVAGDLTQSALAPDLIEDASLHQPGEEQQLQPTATAGGSDSDDNITDPALATIHTGRVPVYRKLGPFQTKRVREIVHSVIANLDTASIEDDLPTDLIERHGLIPRAQALAEIHFPPEDATIADYEMFRSPAQLRMIFDEFFWLSFAMQLLRGERQKEPKGTVIEISDTTKERLKDLLPFTLTAAQKKVIGEIFADLKSDAPMNRLIQGDVGSGKTIVAFLAMFAAMENGYQAALMAPTEILADQHFRNATQIFADTEYKIAMLIGSTKAAEKRKVHAALAAGEINAVVGTHAIIQDAVEFDRLGLAVIDEQHRFGVMQRAHLKAAGKNPDILVMTATPIPRSLAMTVYGDLDVSIIDELPPGRTPIKTVVCGEDKRQGVYRGIEREVKLGRQAYVVYPLIEESAKSDLKAATIMYEDLRTRVFPQYRVGLLHGRMKPAEKEDIMREFVAGRLDILVSTTVIEVGVDVPNASLMVIEHAERFGLSQLHQLRGRVGRGAEQSYCVLLADYKRTAVAKERLGIMEQTSDGFKIAEKDLEIRGQGEILGTRQSGIQNFKLGNIVRDLDILIAARKEAEHYLSDRRLSPETSKMVKRARSDKNVALGGIA
ncbi:MAG: ATP-dependent DNA helicase RecG [Pyrinomonadaceae bacterium]